MCNNNNNTAYYMSATGCRQCRLICDPPYVPVNLPEPPAECLKKCLVYQQNKLITAPPIGTNVTTPRGDSFEVFARFETVSATGGSFTTILVFIVGFILLAVFVLILILCWKRVRRQAQKIHEYLYVRSGGVAETAPPAGESEYLQPVGRQEITTTSTCSIYGKSCHSMHRDVCRPTGGHVTEAAAVPRGQTLLYSNVNMSPSETRVRIEE